MPSRLLSGPAGAGKTQEARRLAAEATTPTVIADFQAILSSLLLLERRADGRYPEREPSDAYAMPLSEYLRRTVITAAQDRDLDVITTNSDGSPARRAELLSLLGAGASETIIDPGKDVVVERLSVNATLSNQCDQAINRWYGRL